MAVFEVKGYECGNLQKSGYGYVAKFLENFMSEDVFGTLFVINSKFLMNKKCFGITNETHIEIPTLSQVEANITNILQAGIGKGHLSVIFSVKNNSFIKKYLEKTSCKFDGYVAIFSGGSGDPCSQGQAEILDKALCELMFNKFYDVVYSFSHDAECFYEIVKNEAVEKEGQFIDPSS